MQSLDCLAPRGMMVSFGNASGPVDPFPPGLLAQKGALFLNRPTLFHYVAARADLEQAAGELFEMVSNGKVRVEINQRFALEDTPVGYLTLVAPKTAESTIIKG